MLNGENIGEVKVSRERNFTSSILEVNCPLPLHKGLNILEMWASPGADSSLRTDAESRPLALALYRFSNRGIR